MQTKKGFKFNWGWGILLTILAFIIFMSTLVYHATQIKVDFVTDNYYEKELKFQEQIDRQQESASLQMPLQIKYNAEHRKVEINYPETSSPEMKGEIFFYKPDNSDFDFKVKADGSQNNVQLVSASAMKAGWWVVKLTWEDEGRAYYNEEKIFVE